MTEFRIEPRPYDHADARDLVEAIQRYYQQIYGGHDDDRTAPAQFAPPEGLFLVGYLGGLAVASGGWRRRDPATAEIKRMFVADQARGRGLARRLLAELESTAMAAGVSRMVLNTGFRQLPAITLYESSGYRRTTDRFGFYAEADGAVFFTKDL